MLFGREQLVICLRIVTIWLDCGECFSLKNLKVKMIQVKPSIHNQVGFLWSPVHIDLAPRCLEDNSCHLEGIFFLLPEVGFTFFSLMLQRPNTVLYLERGYYCLKEELFFGKSV